MKQGKLWILFGLAIIVSMAFYFMINPSYQRSLEAKFYYAIGEYHEAHRLATEAFDLDPYNRMAATVMAQSTTALQFVRYIDEAKAYMEQISAIADSKSITEAQKAKMRLICQIMMDTYVKISPIKRDGRTMLLDEALLNEAKEYYDQFVELHEKLTSTL